MNPFFGIGCTTIAKQKCASGQAQPTPGHNRSLRARRIAAKLSLAMSAADLVEAGRTEIVARVPNGDVISDANSRYRLTFASLAAQGQHNVALEPGTAVST
jgi:hypothetical protein